MTTNKFYLGVIAILTAIVIFQRACDKPIPCPEGGKPTVITKTDTQYITNTVETITYRPGKVKYLPGDTSIIYIDVDTAAILKDYYATRVYNDTVAIDSIGYAYVTDSISRNEIKSRSVSAQYTIPVIVKETTIIIPPKLRNQLYVGIEGIGNKAQPLSYFGPSLVLKTKKDKMYTAGVGYTIDQGFGVKAGILWKIKLK